MQGEAGKRRIILRPGKTIRRRAALPKPAAWLRLREVTWTDSRIGNASTDGAPGDTTDGTICYQTYHAFVGAILVQKGRAVKGEKRIFCKNLMFDCNIQRKR